MSSPSTSPRRPPTPPISSCSSTSRFSTIHKKSHCQVIELFRQLEAGRRIQDRFWHEFYLDSDAYAQVKAGQDSELQEFVSHKVRIDYDPTARLLIVRTPSKVHCQLAASVSTALFLKVQALATEGTGNPDFIGQVAPRGTADVKLRTIVEEASEQPCWIIRSPDASLGHQRTQFPAIVIEVIYANKKEKARQMADSYIIGSDGSIQAVILLDIEYGSAPGSHEASLSVWVPLREEVGDNKTTLKSRVEVEDEVFRDSNGEPINGSGIRLRLSQFARPGYDGKDAIKDDDPEIVLTTEELCRQLAEAEEVYSDKEPAPERVRLGTAAPPEQLTEEVEARFVTRGKEMDDGIPRS